MRSLTDLFTDPQLETRRLHFFVAKLSASSPTLLSIAEERSANV
jgi:hypothetical protein